MNRSTNLSFLPHISLKNRISSMRAYRLWLLCCAVVVSVVEPLPGAAATPTKDDSRAPLWDIAALSNPPKWVALERPKSEGLKAIFYDGLPFRGKPTRVFAWLGLPKIEPGQKAPGMVLVHGGGGTAFEEWVRLWTERGYAAIAMDTCGSVPVGAASKWVHDEKGGPPGWGGWDQIGWPREDQWTYHAVADAIQAHSILRSLPEVDPERNVHYR